MRFSKWWLVASLFIALSLGVAVVAKQMSGRGFDVANLDRTCKPCEDFNRFANGGWLASHPIPALTRALADSRNWQTATAKLCTRFWKQIATRARSAAKRAKARRLYASCMDEAKIEAEGTRPLQSEFARIDAISSVKIFRMRLRVFITEASAQFSVSARRRITSARRT
jgi:predicted metalloendopeptidase